MIVKRREFISKSAGAILTCAAGQAVFAEEYGVADSSAITHASTRNGLLPSQYFQSMHASPTVYPGETIGLWGEFSGSKLIADAVAGPWKGLPAQKQRLIFQSSANVAYGLNPFEECRPFSLRFVAGNRPSILWVNRPRIDWAEHESIYPGQPLRLFGRNLHCVETVQMLAEGGKAIHLEQCAAASYMLTLSAPCCHAGAYTLLVDGEEIVKLRVKMRSSDPIGLQVAWADEFKWNRTSCVPAESLGAIPCDNTEALQKALNDANRNGGGIVQLPPGEFGIRHLDIPSDVVLMGCGPGITSLRYLGGEQEKDIRSAPSIYKKGRVVQWVSSHPMLTVTGGASGVARLSLVCSLKNPEDNLRRIDGYVRGVTISAESSGRCFASDLRIEFASGSGIHAVVGSDLVVQRCNIIVPCTGISVEGLCPQGRITVRECEIANQQRPLVMFNAANSVFERNHLVGQNKVLPWCNGEHRIADVGPSNSSGPWTSLYIADNIAEGIFGSPDENDGEGICFQAGARLAYARVTAAAHNSINDDTQSFKPGSLQDALLFIVKGHGLGQVRRIVSNTTTEVVIEADWDVIPNGDSYYTIDGKLAASRCIIANNMISGVKKRAIDLYCKNYDNWIQGNTIVNAGGVFLNATEDTRGRRLDMSYFNVVCDNTIIGQPTDPATGLPQQTLISTDHGIAWGIRLGNISPKSKYVIPSVAVYGNEIRRNTILGPAPDERSAAIILGADTTVENVPSALGNIVEGNEIQDICVGIRLGITARDTHIRANRFFLRGSKTVEVERGGAL